MKLCKDCKHCTVYDLKGLYLGETLYYCHYHEVITINLVSGKEYSTGTVNAHDERYGTGIDQCGEEGKFWEPKED